ncbi:hypothetical protein PM3016_1465 [Paenibacillus mucilaginosus 3016]|uniref:Phage capsid-like C-terminal domain-containing protein n=1 Tax=Paenibacillus mucilaginosus 3016 TaxID=1116391 RepID=H6NGU8_9BACL|nr:phage major capsid protein [Paenibacillus mucilaginosus]AFC28390.1 hypothetical protein PM3016_1465 [Paenibacillus mucilaginosus 3016]WFA17190.1 phage major capsid protein [Paenibacillus mucilaginosus]
MPGETTIFQLKETLNDMGTELRSITNKIDEALTNPAARVEEIEQMEVRQRELKKRFDAIKARIEEREQESQRNLEQQKRANPVLHADTDEKRMIAAKAELIRAEILRGQVSDESRNLLGAIKQPTATGGEKFLPTNMSNQLITEPLAKNPLRSMSPTTKIKGLEVPKIAYELDDDGFIGDEETAKEIELTGDKVAFGRHKYKVKARISDTVLHGSDVELTTYVENALRSGLAAKEKKVALATTPKAGEEHMSFYSTQNAIKQVPGADKYKAIKAAIADLHEDYRENAKVLMKYSDYLDIVETLANGNATLYSAPPEQVLGKPVEFSDDATMPIVGDFSYAQLNYDGDPVYDTDKNVDKGEYLFVLTGWLDHQILLKSAFRIAKVVATP